MIISFTCIFLFCVKINSFAQENNDPAVVKIYLESWKSRPRLPVDIYNIKENYSFYFETEYIYIRGVDLCYEEISVFLKENAKFENKKNDAANICVEFCFAAEENIFIYFDNFGNYYYNGFWYKMNNELYFALFCYFSNDLIPIQILQKAKE